MLKNNPDTAHYNKLEKVAAVNRNYAKGRSFAGFEASLPNGDSCNVLQLMPKGKYTIVDFWASWCGPCRSAIPHLKSLHKAYEGKLDVISISLDTKEAAWQKAMKEEDMSWTQAMIPAKER